MMAETETPFKPELGYLWHVGDKGCFSPNVGRVTLSREEAEQHNARMEEAEREWIRQTGRAVLYLTKRPGGWVVTNFTGSLVIEPGLVQKGSHNWGCDRYDVWFAFEGRRWHGVNIGDNELLRCKRLKGGR